MTTPTSPDFVIVGGGVAGLVAARTLADAGAQVLMLEAGTSGMPDGFGNLDWIGKRLGPEWRWPGDYPRARVLGGGSVINGMVADVDTPEFYDRWPEGWRFQDVAPFLEMVKARMGTWEPPLGQLSQTMRRTVGAGRVGAVRLFGSADEMSRRTFTHFLRGDESGKLGARIETEVTRLLRTKGQVTGVELATGERIEAGAVILCAGTFGTTDLLERSEISLNAQPVQDHQSIAITFDLTSRHQTIERNTSPITAKITGTGFELLIIDHLSGFRNKGVLMVGETEEAGLADGVRLMKELGEELLAGGVATRMVESPGGYYHAASTLPGGWVVDRTGAPDGRTGLHIMDASVLPSLVRCSPSLTIAAIAAMLATNLANS
jgi:choline dehydrogenase